MIFDDFSEETQQKINTVIQRYMPAIEINVVATKRVGLSAVMAENSRNIQEDDAWKLAMLSRVHDYFANKQISSGLFRGVALWEVAERANVNIVSADKDLTVAEILFFEKKHLDDFFNLNSFIKAAREAAGLQRHSAFFKKEKSTDQTLNQAQIAEIDPAYCKAAIDVIKFVLRTAPMLEQEYHRNRNQYVAIDEIIGCTLS
jgi:hypothetical protein